METSTKLQKSILSASFLKQPTLCRQLLNKYIRFTNLLSNGPVQPSKPLVATMFEVENFDMATIDKNCAFKPIRITNIQSQNHILMTNVKLLRNTAIEMANSDAETTTQCTQCILNVFTNATIQIKSVCLRYFSELFKCILNLDKTLQPMIVWILECVEEIETRIPAWTHHKLVKPDEVDDFVGAVNKVLENQYIIKIFEAKYLRQAINTCLKILQTHHNLKVQHYDKIIPSVYALIKTISFEVGDEFTHSNLYQFVKATFPNDIDFQKNFELLGPVVLEQMKCGHIQSWCLADNKIMEILNHQNSTTETIITHLKCLCVILKTVRSMEHNLTIHLQREMCNKSLLMDDEENITADLHKAFTMHMEKFAKRLLPQMDTLTKYVIQIFSSLLKNRYNPLIDTTTLLLFTDISIGILSAFDASEIDDYAQSQLMLIALCPFIRCSELLYNHLQQTFETETTRLNKIMESPFVRSNDVACWQEYALQMIAGINMKYISNKNKDVFMDFLGQICNNLTQPECLDQVMSVLISCVIQVNTYSITDLEKFIKNTASKTNNYLIISRHLCEFYCISSGLTYILQTNQGNTYPYKVVCSKCDTQTHFDGNKTSIIKQLLDRTNGKFVYFFN